jgi:pSer/pThr/pTyr-binding forkhead associated (FHA) protein
MAKRMGDSEAQKYIDDEIAKAGDMPIAAWLLVLTGKQRGEDFRLREGKNTVGSDPGCDVPIMDEYVSTKHANITIKKTDPTTGLFRVVDLDSANGTFLNTADEPVHAEELVDNDTITFGKVRCRFKCVG